LQRLPPQDSTTYERSSIWVQEVGTPKLQKKLQVIEELGLDADRDDLCRSLLFAYTSCLTVPELAEAAIRTIDGSLSIRRAVVNQLLKKHRGREDQQTYDQLGRGILALVPANSRSAVRIDALLSHLYHLFGLEVRRAVLERWRMRKTRSTGTRWLKAMSSDDDLFRLEDVITYWRETNDARAAKVLAYRSNAKLLTTLLPELVTKCNEGWIISRVALGANTISNECWTEIRARFPGSYAYLCAKLGRRLSNKEALALVVESGASWPSDERNLVIWAIGQLGMWSTLRTIQTQIPGLHATDLERLQKNACVRDVMS